MRLKASRGTPEMCTVLFFWNASIKLGKTKACLTVSGRRTERGAWVTGVSGEHPHASGGSGVEGIEVSPGQAQSPRGRTPAQLAWKQPPVSAPLHCSYRCSRVLQQVVGAKALGKAGSRNG